MPTSRGPRVANLRPRRIPMNPPFASDDKLAAKRARQGDEFCGRIFKIEDDLAEAFTVTKIRKDESLALIAAGIDPAADGDGLADMTRTERAAHV